MFLYFREGQVTKIGIGLQEIKLSNDKEQDIIILNWRSHQQVESYLEYNNIQIKEGDKWKVAFLINKGTFEPQVMYFGLCNSPETF